MARKNWLFVLMAALIAATLVAGCAAPPAQQAAKKKKVGFSVFDMQYGFFQEMEKGTREAAEKAGYDYVLVDQKSSESTMVSATQDLINQGIDALIISPFRPDAMGPLVDAAKKKGIPVVVNDIGGGGTAYDVIVISNNAEGGVMAADQMDKLIKANGSPSKKVAVITNNPDAVYAWQRNVNFEKRIKELGYEVVASLNGSSQQEKGYSLTKDILVGEPRCGRHLHRQRPDGRGRGPGHRGQRQERRQGRRGDRLQCG